ncbi:YopX family protein [uncultured Alistipes sp.]|uniref:YopX family protein n=1 Tax=uncultured Alistipes sp. TaxID=538949 RepID=UPI00272B8002|nr:YopX family protein [uncultured Alistipes sp.]
MKREIKFRGKRLDNGKWITGSPTFIQDDDGIWLEDEDLDVVKVDPDTLGQYTGLKDKDGKEVYEGDIVLHLSNKDAEVEYAFVENTSGIDPKHLHYYAVLWNKTEGGFGYVLLKEIALLLEEIGIRNPDMCGFNPNLGFLVGNIYDNLELVKSL